MNYESTRVWKSTKLRLKRLLARAIKREGRAIDMTEYLDLLSRQAEKRGL